VLDARDRETLLKVADAGLVAADAGADVVDPVSRRLARHRRVADHRPGHAAHVGLAGGYHGLGLLRLVDPARDQYRDIDRLLHRGGKWRNIGALDEHRRHYVGRRAELGRTSSDDVDVVERRGQSGDRLQRLRFLQPLRVLLVAGYAQADDKIIANCFSNLINNFTEKSQAIFEATAIFVIPDVHMGIEELRRQVAVAGDDLDPVDPGLLHPPRARAIALDDLPDDRLGQSPRNAAEPVAGRDRGGVGDRDRAVLGFKDFSPRMEQLREDLRAVGMHRPGQFRVAGDAFVAGGHQDMGGIAGAVMDTRDLHHDQSGAALRARRVIGDQGVVHGAVRRQHGVVPGRQNPVADLDIAYGDGGKEVVPAVTLDRVDRAVENEGGLN
jgi:hypothetical protein